MSIIEKKEKNLNQLINKLDSLTLTYSQPNYEVEKIKTEKNEILRQKNELEKKNQQLIKEHKLLKEKIKSLDLEVKKKSELEDSFNQDIEELSQETETLVSEIEKMANINVKFNNKDYLLSCDDGQEESLKKLTKFLDKKYSELKDKLGNIGENKLLLITTIQLIDEYFDLKQKIMQQKEKLDKISDKFKEIKSLAIEYKKDKDTEIKNLNEKLESFKVAIEENNNLYESMLDKTTQSLEKIISNTESLSKIQ